MIQVSPVMVCPGLNTETALPLILYNFYKQKQPLYYRKKYWFSCRRKSRDRLYANIEAKVTRAFNTSMEVHLKVWGEDFTQQFKYKSNEAYYTFVALDPHRKPRTVPEITPQSEEEQRLYDGALRRRQVRLILGGKMKPNDAI